MSVEVPSHFPSLHIVNHPLISNKMAHLRDVNTSNKCFRELCHEITLLLGYEALKNLRVDPVDVSTPMTTCSVPMLSEPQPVVLPILRAGIGMVDALLALMPTSKVGYIGLYRDEETHKPKHYYFKIPKDSATRRFIVCDPMLATGGSAVAAITELKNKGVTNITFICLLCAPEGVNTLMQAHPDVSIFTASLDSGLNENAYILPGLGDAGDRIFGTQ
jgi:uracil phosphoribosyltransferase